MTNIPDRLASVMFPEGPRVTSVADGKMANAATFTFLREDHTLGNMLRMCVATGPTCSPRPAGARFPPPVPAAAARTPAAPNLPTRTPRRARLLPRRELLRDIDVKFAGYKHPHPLDVDIVLKVQSHSSERGTPAEVVNRALGRLINEVTSLRSSVRQQILQIRQREEQIGGGGGGGGGR